MKIVKIISLLSVIFIPFLCVSQSNVHQYEPEFRRGYQEGYCSNLELRRQPCYPPSPPKAPSYMYANGYRNGGYNDYAKLGYQTGYSMGQNMYIQQDNQKRRQASEQQRQQSEQQRQADQQQQLQQNQQQQQQYQQQKAQEKAQIDQKREQTRQNYEQQRQQQQVQQQQRQQELQRQQQIQQQKAIKDAYERMKKTEALYASFDAYPASITNGWKNVQVSYNNAIADCKALIKENKITELVVNDYQNIDLAFSGNISKGKSLIKIKTNGTTTDFIEVFFIENIIDQSATTTRPLKAGSISLWTKSKKFRKFYIYMGEQYVGTFTQRFDNAPNCNTNGTFKLQNLKPGVYTFSFMQNKLLSRTGVRYNIEVKEGQCKTYFIDL